MNADGTPLRIEVLIRERNVLAQVWRGRCWASRALSVGHEHS